MKKLIVMVGIPASGKSTYCKNHFNTPDCKYISRDEVRFSIVKEDEEYFSKEKEVFNQFVELIKDAIKNDNYSTIIADATHLNERSRAKLMRALGPALIETRTSAIVMKPSLTTALKRNENRTGRKFVPKGQIRRMYSSMTMPTEEEGFDEIIVIKERRN